MPAISITEQENEQNEIFDDLSDQFKKEEDRIDIEKLAALKAKIKAKENKMIKKDRSLQLGIVGTGQGGSRLSQAFYKLGYNAIAINTAMQDLKYIELPESNKLLLEQIIGGCAKDLALGHEAAENNRDLIAEVINDKLQTSQVNILCSSLGGGSGSGSMETLVSILSDTGKPLVVICILPMTSEDLQNKINSIETLSKLAKLVQSKKINNLLIVDNSKLESIYSNVSQIDFYDVANKNIVEIIDVFNTLSAMPSPIKALDSMEWSKLLLDGDGCSVYGELTVKDYKEDTAIAEAVINNLDSNLLAEGFDLKQSKYVGFIVAANKNTWSKIPSTNINYASAMIDDICGSPKNIFKASYVVDSMKDDIVQIYSFFTGLNLPTTRLDHLKQEIQKNKQLASSKDENRVSNMQLNTGTHDTVSAAQKVRDRIAQKSSALGKLIDRRK